MLHRMDATLCWAHAATTGLALDVAGAVVLGWAFSTKHPEQMRKEVPVDLSAPNYPGAIAVPFPQELLRSLVRQRAEARLGLTLLVAGFVGQAVPYIGGSSLGLQNGTERILALALAVIVWLTAAVAMRVYVPRAERRTLARVPDGGLYRGAFDDIG
jgi:hypothetical protein